MPRFIVVSFISILLSLTSNSLFAQAFNYFEKEMAENNKLVGFNIKQQFATNSLTSGFVLDFLNGKFLTEEQKNNCIANFEGRDILAGENFNISLSYQRRLSDNYFLYLELGETFFYETKFHEDIFVLLFKGNKSFENKTAFIDPLFIKSLQYFYFKAGFHRITDRFSFKCNIGYTGGQRFLDLKTNRGSLFTATDGRYIELDLFLNSLDINPGNRALTTISGSGIITDANLSYSPNNNIHFGLGLDGYGFINWTNSTQRTVDTLYRFEGQEISNILDSFSIDIKDASELKSSFIKEKEGIKHRSSLPYIAYLHYSQFIVPEILQLQLRYGIIDSDFAKPFWQASGNLYFTSSTLIGLNVGAGGYGGFNLGAQFAKSFSNKTSLHLYFNSISNLIKPSREMNLTGGMIYRRAL